MVRFFLIFLLCGSAAVADAVDKIAATAKARFGSMPDVVTVPEIVGRCGATEEVNQQAVYCTTRNQILIAADARSLPEAPYLVAHLFGHAVQVQHGVADFALSEIRARRREEAMLRGLVERQVDCIAGFLFTEAGLAPTDLADLVADDPFDGIHWGRDPLRIGPTVSIGRDARAEWFAVGQGGDLAACGPGEFTADLLLEALRR